MDLHQLARAIETWASELGFREIATTDTDLSDYEPKYRHWLEQKFHGSLGYLERNVEKRLDPERLEPGTIRVLSAKLDYLVGDPPHPHDIPANDGSAYIARYARGRDYHKVFRRRLATLARRIDDAAPGHYRAFTDSAPVLEKPLAEKAGLGWIGKNTLLLDANGSWCFLGEIFTDLPLPTSTVEPQPGCGACQACINVCPTDAIISPGVLDATRCISYWTIESKASIPESMRRDIGNRVFGCDDCQIVCPWNRFAPATPLDDFAPRNDFDDARLTDLLDWDEQTFLAKTEGMAIRRINYAQWVRNLAVAAGNAPFDAHLVAALEKRRRDAPPLAVEHIEWALSELRDRGRQGSNRKNDSR